MEAGYILNSMAELGYLTPLEKAVLGSNREFSRWAAHTYDLENDLRVEEVSHELMRLWQASTPLYRYYTAVASILDWDATMNAIAGHTAGIVTREIRNRVNVPEEEIQRSVSLTSATMQERLMEQFNTITTILDAGAPVGYTTTTLEFERMVEDYQVVDLDNCTPDEHNRLTVSVPKSPPKSVLRRTENKLLAEGKRALRRAYNFFMDHERGDELRLFIDGGNVEVSHKDSDLKFVFKRNARLHLVEKSTETKNKWGQWSNIDVEIHTKTNVFICGVCVYIRDTPVLDQLMALIMLVEAGLEEELIEKGNTKHINNEVVFEDLALKSPSLRKKLEDRKKIQHFQSGVQVTPDQSLIISTYNHVFSVATSYTDSWRCRIRDNGTTNVITTSTTGRYQILVNNAALSIA